MKRILGIDPGFATIGFGLIAAEAGTVQMLRYGAITTPAGMEFPQRLKLIYDDMLELLELLVLPDVPPLTVSSSLLLVTVQSL